MSVGKWRTLLIQGMVVAIALLILFVPEWLGMPIWVIYVLAPVVAIVTLLALNRLLHLP